MALEPAWLEGDGAACGGPVCAVSYEGVASACGERERAVSDPPRTCSRGKEEGKGKSELWCEVELTRIHPLHAIGECVVGDEVIASPAGVGDDGVCGG